MKKVLVLAAVLLLAAVPALADEAAAGVFVDDVAAKEGGCVLPDLAGLSAEEIEEAALEAGFALAPMDKTTPACPVRFACRSITNCQAGPLCALTDIGPCCDAGGGLGLCCISGTIKVTQCPCECSGNPCNIQCPNSTEVRWRCS